MPLSFRTLHRCRWGGQGGGPGAGREPVGGADGKGEVLVWGLGEGGVDLAAEGVDAVGLIRQTQVHL